MKENIKKKDAYQKSGSNKKKQMKDQKPKKDVDLYMTWRIKTSQLHLLNNGIPTLQQSLMVRTRFLVCLFDIIPSLQILIIFSHDLGHRLLIVCNLCLYLWIGQATLDD